MDKQAIFIFTKDRPDLLSNTLKTLENIQMPVYLIDDSNDTEYCETNKRLLSENQFYLGQNEFNQFLIANMINADKYSFVLRTPGTKSWNLGFMRNFGLIYSKYQKFDRVLFMDDDINVPNLDIIHSTLQNLDRYKLCGVEITGLVDDSIAGHIATGLDVHNIRTLSGGFMAFRPNESDNYFLNCYNEDWIWIFMESQQHEEYMEGAVLQELSDPMRNWENKIQFQEFGEIALDGLIEIRENHDKEETLQDIHFWEKILAERQMYILELYRLTHARSNNCSHSEILQYLINNQVFNAESFKNLFADYYSSKKILQELQKSF